MAEAQIGAEGSPTSETLLQQICSVTEGHAIIRNHSFTP